MPTREILIGNAYASINFESEIVFQFLCCRKSMYWKVQFIFDRLNESSIFVCKKGMLSHIFLTFI